MPSSDETRKRRIAQHLRDAARVLDLYKTSRGCADCGYRAHPAALHFDHIDPQTKLPELGWQESRSKLTTRPRFERYLQHVEAYCEVRCANCHAVRTMTEKHWRNDRSNKNIYSESSTLF